MHGNTIGACYVYIDSGYTEVIMRIIISGSVIYSGICKY